MNNPNHILLVEDDSSIRELLEEILTLEGYSVLSAANGLLAQSLLQHHSFDLIITDFKMPGLDGLELIKWCRSQNIQSESIIMTATSLAKDRQDLSNSLVTIIDKPLKMDFFLKTVHEALSNLSEPQKICS